MRSGNHKADIGKLISTKFKLPEGQVAIVGHAGLILSLSLRFGESPQVSNGQA
jgi:hypothetical protein